MTGEDFDVAFDVSYNKDLLVQNLSQSSLVAGGDQYQIEAPRSAHVEYDKKQNQVKSLKKI